MSFKAVILSSAFLAAELVAGHGGIIKTVGSAGGESMGLGVDPDTPHDGTRRDPFQMDSTRFRGDAASFVGETLGGGTNDVEIGTKAIMGMTGQSLAQVTPGGELMMTLHQVNADGAGPYTCMINSDGTAQGWQNIQVTQNIDGNQRGRNRDGSMQDLPLNVQIPAGQQNVCMVRCQNPARAGPFGGVVPVQMAGAAGAAGAAPAGGAAAPGAAPAATAQKRAPANSNSKRAAFVKRIDPITRAIEFSD